jgi:hypothetical protein
MPEKTWCPYLWVNIETFAKRPFLPNPPVEDTAIGEADKFLRLPCEMRSLFLWGQAQILILKILNVFMRLKFSPSLNLNKNEHFSKVSITDLRTSFFPGFF